MHRQVKFRAKVWQKDAYVYGYLFELEPPLQCVGPVEFEESVWYITTTGFADWNMPRSPQYIRVHPETIGEWVGLHDRNNIEIYEGDRVRCLKEGDATVEFRTGTFGLLADHNGFFYPFNNLYGECEVLPNEQAIV